MAIRSSDKEHIPSDESEDKVISTEDEVKIVENRKRRKTTDKTIPTACVPDSSIHFLCICAEMSKKYWTFLSVKTTNQRFWLTLIKFKPWRIWQRSMRNTTLTDKLKLNVSLPSTKLRTQNVRTKITVFFTCEDIHLQTFLLLDSIQTILLHLQMF